MDKLQKSIFSHPPVSHDLKAKLTSVKAYGQILEKYFIKQKDIKSFGYVSKMNQQVNNLTKMIVDLLEVEKIVSEKIHLQKEKWNFDEFMKQIIEDLSITGSSHKIILEGKTNREIIADKNRLGKVCMALLSNAMKYSPKGKKITIKISQTDEHVLVCIKDAGIGIAKKDQGKIFERFYQGNHIPGNYQKGLGIGLYIAAEIVKAHGGKIWCESILQKGSTFYFTVPLTKANHMTQKLSTKKKPYAKILHKSSTKNDVLKVDAVIQRDNVMDSFGFGKKKKVLIVDDDPHIAEAIKIVLENEGYTVITASSGKSALKIISETIPHVILLDFFLPGENTDTIITSLRNEKMKNIPIILMSASNTAKEAVTSWNLNAFLPKPFQIDSLVKMVEQYSLGSINNIK